MWVLRAVRRTLKLVSYFIAAGTELALRPPDTRQARAEWLHKFAARAARGLNLTTTVVGEFPATGAVISNHLSYLDIVVFASIHPCVFVSKAEIEEWPVIGWMTTMSGTVYVQRGHGGSARRACGAMSEAADAGLPVVFFPEGTTSNGDHLLRFHAGLLGQAMLDGLPVTAAHIGYSFAAKSDPGATLRDDVYYWGNRSMWPHVFRFLGLRAVQAELRFAAEPIAFSPDARAHRKIAAMQAQAAVQGLRLQ